LSFEFVDLDVGNATQSRTLQWFSDCLDIQNNTPYPLYINWRTTAIPTRISYEMRIPAGMNGVKAARGNNFGFFLDTGGTSIPAEGAKCTIVIQVDEVIANYSQTNWRSSFNDTFSNLDGATLTYDINTAGASGLALNVQLNTGSAGIVVEVQTSGNGENFKTIRRFRVNLAASLARVFPVTVDFSRVNITNFDPTQNTTGVFTYALLSYYSPIPIVYKSSVVSNYVASLASAATLTGSQIFGTFRVEDIFLFFRAPTASPTVIDLSLQMTIDGQLYTYHLTNPPYTVANEAVTIQLESDIIELVHRRLNEWGFRIRDLWQGNSDFRLDVNNLSAATTFTEIRVGYKVDLEA